MEQTVNRRTFKGVVISDGMDKTVVVRIERFMQHPKYRKYMKKSKNFKAHDEANASKKGDTVTIEECRPVSKDKHFRVLRSEQGERL